MNRGADVTVFVTGSQAPGSVTLFAPDGSPAGAPPSVVVEARVVHLLFRDEESLFTAAKVRRLGDGDDGEAFTAVGEFLTVAVGDEFTLTGKWGRHPKWGPQFQVAEARARLPREPRAIVAYLSGGLFPGIGERLAGRLVRHFGEATLETILERPQRVEEVPGIGAKKRARLESALQAHQSIQDLALFLQGHGVSLYLVKKIAERYGHQALEVVRSDPYRAADEVPRIGFLTADRIARRIGLPADAPARLRAAPAHVLRRSCDGRGHSYVPLPELVRESLDFLNRDAVDGAGRVTGAQVEGAVAALVASGRLVRDGTVAVYLREAHEAECALARRVRALQAAAFERPAELEAAVARSAASAGVEYSDEQRAAIAMALASPVAVVTGGPGTGKSTVVRGVLAALTGLRPETRVHLAAATGRAAKRIEELSGASAKTVHRLLEYSPQVGAFQRGEADPLDGDLLVVDEASMLDLYLAHALFQAVPEGMQVLLVGDADQLPSVGFGNVFADFIRSRVVPVVRLRHIFRQALQSRIVINAHRVNQGEMPLLEAAGDWEFVAIDDPAEVAEFIRRAALAHRASGRPIAEFNVLTPMRKTETGAAALNRLLQQALNPGSPGKREVRSGEAVLRVGDKVMQIRNNYGKEVYNGDVGILTAIRLPDDATSGDDDEDEERIVVAYPGQEVTYGREELDQIALAYAATVHKSQGSEYAGVVVVPVVNQHYVMLQRNLLYTAITRARDRVVLVGQAAAIRRAVGNVGSRRRYSHLAHRLREARGG